MFFSDQRIVCYITSYQSLGCFLVLGHSSTLLHTTHDLYIIIQVAPSFSLHYTPPPPTPHTCTVELCIGGIIDPQIQCPPASPSPVMLSNYQPSPHRHMAARRQWTPRGSAQFQCNSLLRAITIIYPVNTTMVFQTDAVTSEVYSPPNSIIPACRPRCHPWPRCARRTVARAARPAVECSA